MLKKLKIGARLSLGFGVLILIIFLLGTMAVINMRGIRSDMTRLNEQYIPEMLTTTEIERSWLQTMFDMHGYTFSLKDKYYENGYLHMKNSQKNINLAIERAQQTENITILQSMAGELKNGVNDYMNLIEKTKESIDQIKAQRTEMEKAATEAIKNIHIYIESQSRKFENDISKDASKRVLRERFLKLKYTTEILETIDEIRMYAWKAQAFRERSFFEKAIEISDTVKVLLRRKRSVTRGSIENKTLDKIDASINDYLNAVLLVDQNWKRLIRLKKEGEEVATATLENMKTSTVTGVNTTSDIANITVSSLNRSIWIIFAGILVAICIGVIVAFKIYDSIAKPIASGMKFAKAISMGYLDTTIDIERKDEIGELILAVDEMSSSFKAAGKIILKVSNGDFTGAEKLLNESELPDKFIVSISTMLSNLNRSVDLAKHIAHGQLDKAAEITSQNTRGGEMDLALQTMVVRIKEVVESIVTGTENIVATSTELNANTQVISRRASEQAASTEQISSSMEEMLANIQQNTENAIQTRNIAMQAAHNIADNSNSSSIVVASIKEIAEKITIIGEIALQTNILALNAAVEAARAGLHGRGFAVVASEVKELAERSKIAANQIDELSKSGVELAINTGAQLKTLVPEIEKTAQLVQEISSSSSEQRSGAKQVNNSIQQLNSIAKQNATFAEEMATSTEELNAQAEEMKRIISFFKIEKSFAENTMLAELKTPSDFKEEAQSSKKENNEGVDLDMNFDDNLDDGFDHF
ncbi:MAG: hypothetical protein CSA05_00250 [Bacteroidia bacterium]|nr:MAG: hypothetical protein CSA05_00250 [Bacteroidia bacterium]